MPDDITLDDALKVKSTSAPNAITFDDALAQRQTLMRPAAGQFPQQGEQRVPGEGLPGSPSYRPAMIAPSIAPAPQANAGLALKTSLVEDIDTKRRLIAERLFPDDPKGIERVGIVEGVPVFVNDEGKLQRVSGPLAQLGAATVANAPEMIGGGVGALAGMGTPGSVAGAAMGAAGARGLKRAAAGLMFDEPQTIPGNLKDIAGEAAVSALGAGVGRGVAAFGNRGKLMDFTPADIKSAEAARAHIKQRTGIDLDLAQASGDRKLLALRDYAARFPGKTADLIEARDNIASGQFDQAVDKVLNMVAQASPAEVSGGNAVNAAQMTMALTRKELQRQVKPIYDAAYATKTEITNPRMLQLAEVKPVKAAINKARDLINTEARRIVVTEDDPLSLQMLDYAKQIMDDEVERLAGKGLLNEARIVGGARDDMVKFLDNVSRRSIKTIDPRASPDRVISLYQAARRRYGELYQETMTPLENSPIGVLANLHPKNAQLAARVLSDPGVTPYQIAVLKGGLQRSDPVAYRGLVRSWLADKYNTAMRETQSGSAINPAGKFRQAVMGTPRDVEKARAMLPADAADAFNDLMEAAEQLAKTPLGASRVSGSNTARDLQITETLKQRALGTLRWLMYPRQSIKEAAEQRIITQDVEALTEALIDPAKRSQLRRIVKMAPSTRKLILLGSVLGAQTTQLQMESGETITPEALGP